MTCLKISDLGHSPLKTSRSSRLLRAYQLRFALTEIEILGKWALTRHWCSTLSMKHRLWLIQGQCWNCFSTTNEFIRWPISDLPCCQSRRKGISMRGKDAAVSVVRHAIRASQEKSCQSHQLPRHRRIAIISACLSCTAT